MAHIDLNMKRCSLELYNYNPTYGLGWGSGRAGFWKRNKGLGYCYETYLRSPDDFTELYGSQIDNAILEITCNNQGNQYVDGSAYLYKQNKTPFDLLNNPPVYSDFPSEEWDTTIDTEPMKSKGVYQFTSTGIKNLVQQWADGAVNFKEGLILGIDFQALNWWLSIDNAVLKIDYSIPAGSAGVKKMLNSNGVGQNLLG